MSIPGLKIIKSNGKKIDDVNIFIDKFNIFFSKSSNTLLHYYFFLKN